MTITGGRFFEIAPESPREYVDEDRPDVFRRASRVAGGPGFRLAVSGTVGDRRRARLRGAPEVVVRPCNWRMPGRS